MDIEKFRKIIDERERISVESHDEWDCGIQQCWEKEVAILSENIEATINFLQKDCTAEEFSCISEIIDDLISQSQSKTLLDNYKALMHKYPQECKKYSIIGSIEFAEANLQDGQKKKPSGLLA